jgi:hypothetical protein
MKTSFKLKNKIRKIKSPVQKLEDLAIKAQNMGLGETIYINSLRGSKTVPNSHHNSPTVTNSHSGSNGSNSHNMCNQGSQSNSNSDKDKNKYKISVDVSKSDSNSLFKTISDKLQLDPYLHVKYNI